MFKSLGAYFVEHIYLLKLMFESNIVYFLESIYLSKIMFMSSVVYILEHIYLFKIMFSVVNLCENLFAYWKKLLNSSVAYFPEYTLCLVVENIVKV